MKDTKGEIVSIKEFDSYPGQIWTYEGYYYMLCCKQLVGSKEYMLIDIETGEVVVSSTDKDRLIDGLDWMSDHIDDIYSSYIDLGEEGE